MAVPAILLKAKKAAQNLKKSKTTKEAIQDDGQKKSFIGLFMGLPFVAAILLPIIIITMVVLVVICLPQTFFTIFGAVGNNTAYANEGGWDSLYFKQCGNEWSAGGSSICQSGCGLCSITHVIDLLTGETFTPLDISNQLREHYNGNVSAYAPGGSIVSSLVSFATEKYGLTSTHYNNIDEVANAMKSGGKVVICSDNGDGNHFVNADGSMYSADHVIMAYKYDGENFWIKDSGRGGNSVQYTKEQLSKIDYVGWYVLEKA